MFSTLFVRTQPRVPWSLIATASLGTAATIALLGILSDSLGFPLLAAAFGSSCVLVFTMPHAPLSQPVNVVCGHVASAVCGLLARTFLPTAWWSIALAVGVSLAVMAALRITHPPAGGTPIAVMLAHEGWGYLFAPILAGAVIVACCGMLHRAIVAARERRAAELEAPGVSESHG